MVASRQPTRQARRMFFAAPEARSILRMRSASSPRQHNKLEADTHVMARPRVTAMDQGNKFARVSVRQGNFKTQVIGSKPELARVDAELEAIKAHVKEVEAFVAEESMAWMPGSRRF